MTDRWSPALCKSARCGGGEGGGGVDRPLEGGGRGGGMTDVGGGGMTDVGGGASGTLQKRAVRWRRGGLTDRCRGGGVTDVRGGWGGGGA